MPTPQKPWTCKWGRFGSPVNARDEVSPGFVFWICARPQGERPRLIGRDDCVNCERFEAGEEGAPPSAA